MLIFTSDYFSKKFISLQLQTNTVKTGLSSVFKQPLIHYNCKENSTKYSTHFNCKEREKNP